MERFKQTAITTAIQNLVSQFLSNSTSVKNPNIGINVFHFFADIWSAFVWKFHVQNNQTDSIYIISEN